MIFYARVTDYEREVWSTGQQRYWFVILRWVEVLMGSGQLGLVQCCGHSRAVSGAAPYLACAVMSHVLLLAMAWKQRVCFDVSGNGGAEHLSQLGLLPARLNSAEKKKDSERLIFHFLHCLSFPTCFVLFVCVLFSEEIEKKLNIYRKGCKIWKMLIFCQVHRSS